MEAGAWRAKMSWSANDGRAFYDEFVIMK